MYFSSQKFLVIRMSHRNQSTAIPERLVHLLITVYNHNALLKA